MGRICAAPVVRGRRAGAHPYIDARGQRVPDNVGSSLPDGPRQRCIERFGGVAAALDAREEGPAGFGVGEGRVDFAAEIGKTLTFLIFVLNCLRFFSATASSILLATIIRGFSTRADTPA